MDVVGEELDGTHFRNLAGMRRRRWVRLVSLLAAGYLTVSLLVGVMVMEGALHPCRCVLTAADEGLGQELENNRGAELTEGLSRQMTE